MTGAIMGGNESGSSAQLPAMLGGGGSGSGTKDATMMSMLGFDDKFGNAVRLAMAKQILLPTCKRNSGAAPSASPA
jgi:hypothetical protein